VRAEKSGAAFSDREIELDPLMGVDSPVIIMGTSTRNEAILQHSVAIIERCVKVAE
jgi:hypothetical protein